MESASEHTALSFLSVDSPSPTHHARQDCNLSISVLPFSIFRLTRLFAVEFNLAKLFIQITVTESCVNEW